MTSNRITHNFSFDPTDILKEAERMLLRQFKERVTSETQQFFDEKSSWQNSQLVRTPGAGLLLIRKFLEEKFDDPNTTARMQKFFDENFDRIMQQAMEKALQHKANAFVFKKVKEEVKER